MHSILIDYRLYTVLYMVYNINNTELPVLHKQSLDNIFKHAYRLYTVQKKENWKCTGNFLPGHEF